MLIIQAHTGKWAVSVLCASIVLYRCCTHRLRVWKQVNEGRLWLCWYECSCSLLLNAVYILGVNVMISFNSRLHVVNYVSVIYAKTAYKCRISLCIWCINIVIIKHYHLLERAGPCISKKHNLKSEFIRWLYPNTRLTKQIYCLSIKYSPPVGSIALTLKKPQNVQRHFSTIIK